MRKPPPRQTTPRRSETFKLIPLRSVKVGDKVRLLPDDLVKIRNHEYKCSPNNSLGIPFDTVLTVDGVEIEEQVALIKVTCSFKLLRMERFAKA